MTEQTPRGWFRAPRFENDELTQRAGVVHRLVWIGMAAGTLALGAVVALQPELAGRTLPAIAVLVLVGLAVLEISRRGYPNVASVIALMTVIAVATALSPGGGGIRSPGATLFFAFVLFAGVLLGHRAALVVAAVCAVIGTLLVVAELNGMIEPAVRYGPVALLVVNFLYMVLILTMTRLLTSKTQSALNRAEQELAERVETERRLEMALGAGGMGIWQYDPGRDVYHLDGRALAMFNRSPAEPGTLSPELVRELVHPEDRHLIGKLADLAEKESNSCGFRIVNPDGSIRHVFASGTGTRPGPDQPVRVVGMLMDVTAQREATLERERLLYDLGERVKELTLLQNVARMLHARSFFDRAVLSEIVRLMPAGWQYPEHCEARIVFGDETYATPGWRETPWRQTKDFETSTAHGLVEVAYTREFPPAAEGPFLAEERALIDSIAEMLVGHLESEHIEEMRRGLEGQLRQSQKMEALGTLAGGIAHDFNNILTAIGGNVELALLDARDERMRAYLEEVKHAHERARDLVKRILVFGRRQEATKRVIALQPVVEEALRLIRATVGHGIRLETRFASDVAPVLADSTQIHQVLLNLATNAAHAMRESGGVLTVSLDERTTRNPMADRMPAELNPGRYVRLSMRDSGSGMTADVRERIFEPFFTTKGVLGTGLGLSVVHGIVHDHGGGICVESEPGRGTLFELYFPAAVEIAETSAPSERLVARGAGQRILYVDDEEAVLFVMTRTLERLGYRATGFTAPAEALRVFAEDPTAFDAVVSDMGMPGMSGLELARELKRIRPDLPIAIASGYARPQTEAEEISAWIHKPPSRRELAEMLAGLVGTDVPETG